MRLIYLPPFILDWSWTREACTQKAKHVIGPYEVQLQREQQGESTVGGNVDRNQSKTKFYILTTAFCFHYNPDILSSHRHEFTFTTIVRKIKQRRTKEGDFEWFYSSLVATYFTPNKHRSNSCFANLSPVHVTTSSGQ